MIGSSSVDAAMESSLKTWRVAHLIHSRRVHVIRQLLVARLEVILAEQLALEQLGHIVHERDARIREGLLRAAERGKKERRKREECGREVEMDHSTTQRCGELLIV